MKLLLQALIALAATASPQAPMNVPIGGPIVQANSPAYTKQMAVWEDTQMRLDIVTAELDGILADVIAIESEEARALDPLVIELYVRKGDLDELLSLSIEGYRHGMLRNANDLAAIQDTLDTEVRALEEAVLLFRTALDEVLSSVIEV